LHHFQQVFVLIVGMHGDVEMLKGGSSREQALTDQALANVLAKRDEYLASLVGADGVCTSLGFVPNRRVD
jgi:hypothetical protein